MKDNFDLRKFLTENKSIENLNPVFRKLNENKEPITENALRAKIREIVLAELEGMDNDEEEDNDYSDYFFDIDTPEDDLYEAKKKDAEEVEDMPVEDEDINLETEPELDMPEDDLSMAAAGATGDSKEMIDHLMKALDNAKSSGNEKLVTQVLNTLKFAIDQSIAD